MQFNNENNIVKLCIQGMQLEAADPAKAKELFMQAWQEATNDFEKFTAAHYVARHQPTVQHKLQWDETALHFALKVKDADMTGSYPSLYLNIARCHEDLQDMENACRHYRLAQHYAHILPGDGYGEMIRKGISNGLHRVCAVQQPV